MPVIIDTANYPAWLGETPVVPEQLLALVRPFPPERMEAYTIGRETGDVRNDNAGLIERLAWPRWATVVTAIMVKQLCVADP